MGKITKRKLSANKWGRQLGQWFKVTYHDVEGMEKTTPMFYLKTHCNGEELFEWKKTTK